MAELLKLTPLQMVFFIHFILISFAAQGWWSSDSILFTNIVFFGTLIWAMHAHDKPEPLQMAIAVNIISIVLDAIVLSLRYPSDSSRISNRFSAGMAVLNIFVRPFSTLLLYNILQERTGTGNGLAYEDIDRPVIHSVPPQIDSYGSQSKTPA